MNTSLLGLLFIYSLVFLRVSLGASTAERALTSPTAGKLSYTQSQSPGTGPRRDEDKYDSNEEELSGDYEDVHPQVAFSTKPKDSSVMPLTQNRRRRKGKKNPCLRKMYRNYCIHGECQYLEGLNHTSCICEPGYAGERCHIFTLPVVREQRYNQTAALAVIAVILSLMCLTFIGIMLAFRCHKKGEDDVESEEKIKLEAATVP
ncbi:heparin-binding EGF-like growth factor b [Colossoma macropomum]|uniref:heparin-binding EGF-like growth factor b n=1 Tax=Colossoma macropomum TaxID=42526 RepID=UPI0018651BC5|nr:heparin-binding EGF-like growth factor b [Colossoma macropomum]